MLPKDTIQAIQKFVQERDWDQFHNAKDLALSISVESAELLEAFLWKNPEEASRENIEEELADVLICSILLAHKMGFSMDEIIQKKLLKNAEKYPIEKAKGSSKKYTDL